MSITIFFLVYQCEKILEENNLGKIYFELSWFQRSLSMVGWTYCFSPEVRQKIKALGTYNQNSLFCGGQEAEKEVVAEVPRSFQRAHP